MLDGSVFKSWQEQEIFHFSKLSRQALDICSPIFSGYQGFCFWG